MAFTVITHHQKKKDNIIHDYSYLLSTYWRWFICETPSVLAHGVMLYYILQTPFFLTDGLGTRLMQTCPTFRNAHSSRTCTFFQNGMHNLNYRAGVAGTAGTVLAVPLFGRLTISRRGLYSRGGVAPTWWRAIDMNAVHASSSKWPAAHASLSRNFLTSCLPDLFFHSEPSV